MQEAVREDIVRLKEQADFSTARMKALEEQQAAIKKKEDAAALLAEEELKQRKILVKAMSDRADMAEANRDRLQLLHEEADLLMSKSQKLKNTGTS